MFACKRTSQKGFSLVELMVVVAIIGVLASIAVPQVNKFIAKARQSEAKTNLASYYTAQKAFQSEYGVYDSRFVAIGYAPEGELRYNVGLGALGAIATASNGYNVTPAPSSTEISANTYCGPAGGAIINNCRMLLGAGGAAVQPLTGTSLTNGAGTSAFVAQAAAIITNTAIADRWTINHQKQVLNTSNGIP